jgi:hypothetical protein
LSIELAVTDPSGETRSPSVSGWICRLARVVLVATIATPPAWLPTNAVVAEKL